MRPAPLALPLLALLACSGGSSRSSSAPDRYADPALWLCNPALNPGGCADDLTATEFLPDGSTRVVPHTPTASSPFDCFYVYPTVDWAGPVGNHTDFTNLAPMRGVYDLQGAPFDALCPVYVPLYRQITLTTYFTGKTTPYLEIAYQDVQDAFDEYLKRWNRGRPFVLLGHSQGSTMLRMLLQREFDGNPGLRGKLVTALLLGGDALVPQGGTLGVSFENIPLCTSDDQVGCFIGFRSFDHDAPPSGAWVDDAPPGSDIGCTNPADPAGGGPALFSESLFPTAVTSFGFRFTLVAGVTTPFALYPDFYSGQCTKDALGYSYLLVATAPAPGDVRMMPFTFAEVGGNTSLGLHVLDYNFPMGDLLRVVGVKGRRWSSP